MTKATEEKISPRKLWGPSYLDARQWSWVPDWLFPYLRPEMLAMLMLGFASGLPLYMFYSKTSIWLRTEGIEKSTIGFFYWIGLAYTLKWLWAPVIDKYSVPILTRLFGHRRSWMMLSIAGTVIGLLFLSWADPSEGLLRVLIGAGLVAFSGATLDVSIDAWRIESAPTKAQANMAASYSLGYRGALFFSGFGVFIAGATNWHVSFAVMALAMAACAGLVALISEPANRRQPAPDEDVPLIAGPWNAVAVGTGLLVLARALRWVKVDEKVIGWGQPLGEWIVWGLAGAGIAALLSGRLLFKGTRASFPWLAAMSGLGTIFVFSRELAAFGTGLPTDSPFFRLAVVVVSLIAAGGYARAVWGSLWQLRAPGTLEHHETGKLHRMFATPFLQVWDRFGKVLIPIIVLVLIYRTSDFTMGVMAGPLYVDLGYSEETIGLIQSFLGVFAVFAGLFVGGVVANQIGVMKAMVAGSVLTLVTNGFYAVFAHYATGQDPGFLALAICADNVAGGFVTTVFIAYLSSLVDPAFAATQYALFSSLYALLNKLLAGFSGMMADAMGYETFFLLTASYAIPAGIMVLVVMAMSSKETPSAQTA